MRQRCDARLLRRAAQCACLQTEYLNAVTALLSEAMRAQADQDMAAGKFVGDWSTFTTYALKFGLGSDSCDAVRLAGSR